MLEKLRRLLSEMLTKRSALVADRDKIVTDAATARGEDANLTADETAAFDEIRSKITALDAELTPLQERIAELEAEEARDAELAEIEKRLLDQPRGEQRHQPIRVGEGPEVYRKDGPDSFLHDIWAARSGHGGGAAAARLAEHAKRAASTTGLGGPSGGLVPPAFLGDLFAPIVRAGSPLRSILDPMPLPATGMEIPVPRQTQGTTSANVAENGTVAESEAEAADLMVPVRTIAGRTKVSFQAIQRAASGFDTLHGRDLARSYITQLGSQLINGPGTGQTHKGLSAAPVAGNTVTFTTGSPTIALLIPKIADVIQRMTTSLLLPPNVIIMHPRRWGWITAAVDSADRPVLAVNTDGASVMASNVFGDGAANGVGIVGSILGIPVLIDPNIAVNLGAGTNQDEILFARTEELHLFHEGNGTPNEISIEVPSALQIEIVVYGYTAFTAERYEGATGKITGTGLITPSF